jgi:hypothetical protein
MNALLAVRGLLGVGHFTSLCYSESNQRKLPLRARLPGEWQVAGRTNEGLRGPDLYRGTGSSEPPYSSVPRRYSLASYDSLSAS